MAEHDEYYAYLRARSRIGKLYRNYVLYPRVTRHLTGRVLDFGCGIGDMLAYRPGTVGVDINPCTVEFCRQRGLEAHLMTPDALPFEASTFDCVLMDNVLEHIESADISLAEIRRVLQPNGCLVVGVPGTRGFASDDDHKQFYDEPRLSAVVEAAGFIQRWTFYTPLFKSSFLSRWLRQYCLYGVFQRGDVAN